MPFSFVQWKLALATACVTFVAIIASPVVGQVPQEFQVPNSQNVEDLAGFLNKMLAYEAKSEEDAGNYQKYAPEAMTTAAQQIMQLEKDASSDTYLFAQKYLLAVDVMAIEQANDQEKQQLKQIILRNISGQKMDADDLDIAVAYAEGLEMTGDTQGAIAAYREFSNVLNRHKDPLIAELGQLMAGSANRLGLMGNQMQIDGTTIDGRPFDFSAYRGRTVLVDFWATWCGPCRAEIPQIQKYYEAYKDRGFEVVGICLDEEKEKVDAFLKEAQLPWVTLFQTNGQTNPTALRYGITALPTTILIDKNGRVVSLAARGETLGKLLTQMLGPIE